ncbi:MAG: malto-oligosyltrehalose synthase [Magnetococcus sp. THC-1_WYH]
MTVAHPSNSDTLARLAITCGITQEYTDVWGKTHPTSEATLSALLTAMHLPLNQDPARLLANLEEKEWRRLIPPVQVLTVGAVPTIPVSIPATKAHSAYHWILTTEQGERSSGLFKPSELQRLEEKKLGKDHFLRANLILPPLLVTGYHRLDMEQPGHLGQKQVTMTLIVAPPSCYQPKAVQGNGRVWGTMVQLYGLRSRRNWGIGDFGDLRTLVTMSAQAGSGVVGVNPTHALMLDSPGGCNPYSPSNRCFSSVLYLDVEAIPEFSECEEARRLVASEAFQSRLRELRSREYIAYETVSVAKLEILAMVYRHFCDHHLANDSPRARTFRLFRRNGGEILEYHARFEALQEHFRRDDLSVWGWPMWPREYHHPQGPAVAEFALNHAEQIEFHIWLQWIAVEQLALLGALSRRSGLEVGLYQDLAVGGNPGGSEAWAWQETLALGATIGTPPDAMHPLGLNWNLPPMVPHRMKEFAYAPWIAILRANMRYWGALRIDHIVGLARQFWIPTGFSPAQGAYVSYPLLDLLGIVALESQRNRCMVIGTDLSAAPKGFRSHLATANVLSYRPFLLERTAKGAFKPPSEYPRQALVAVSRMDLPTLQGFWKGDDLDTRAALQLFSSEEQLEQLVVERAQDRARFLIALKHEGLLPEGVSIQPLRVSEITPLLVIAIHTYLARTRAKVLLVHIDDIFGVVGQASLAGSLDGQHPNWRRRYPLDLEEWKEDGRFSNMSAFLRHERGSAVAPYQDESLPTRTAIIPRATYRFQFNRDFTFTQAAALVSYLWELGVSHCYASPYLKARPGSGHGYDIVDHSALNPEIGTPEEFENFVAALKDKEMGQIIDVVPNHMGVMGADNVQWLDVLENGPASVWAMFFDIDWDPPNPELKNKVLQPLLGDHYGTVLNRGELRLEYDAARGEFSIFYYQHRLPIDPSTYPMILGNQIERLIGEIGGDHGSVVELQALLTSFGHLPSRTDTSPESLIERQRNKEVHKRHLAMLSEDCNEVSRYMTACVTEFNGVPNHPVSFDLMHDLIQAQGYRLAYWRVASDEINYRRFFDINDLAALRMEDPAVFEATHGFILSLVTQGKVDGLRIDHPDGLYDPGEYFRRLHQVVGGTAMVPGAPLPLYLVIEKILADHERLPGDWPIHGATGYRFANLVNNLFVDSTAELSMTRIYGHFIGSENKFADIAYDNKKLIMQTALSSEINVLANRLARIATASRDTFDFTLNRLREALVEVLACFPVYRSYVAHGNIASDDRRYISWSVTLAKKRNTDVDIGIYDFLEGVLTNDLACGRNASFREPLEVFAMKFQQVSPPVMAKGVEDTAFYRYHRLVSLNDVGGEPDRFGISVAGFHAENKARAIRWPHNMLATSTHDSKRSEDVRARINVLSEIAAKWRRMVNRWRRLNQVHKRLIDGIEIPSRNDEYLLYQTLVGTWPMHQDANHLCDDYRIRIETYMVKALREGKEHSSWVHVNTDYEEAVIGFIQALLQPGANNPFLSDFVPQVQRIAHYGLINSLAQTVIKVTSPGVPDIYQGCELWQFNLVDPDNRRPIDFEQRRTILAQMKNIIQAPQGEWPERLRPLLEQMDNGHVKLYTLWRSLSLRRQWPEVFRDGDYQPLEIQGEFSRHACAFARQHQNRIIMALVPRLPVRLLENQGILPMGMKIWGETAVVLPEVLARTHWHNIFSGESLRAAGKLAVGEVLASFPVALLASEPIT